MLSTTGSIYDSNAGVPVWKWFYNGFFTSNILLGSKLGYIKSYACES